MKRRRLRTPATSDRDADACAREAEQLWSDHRRRLRQTRRRPDAARVHALRIGTRRLLARLELVRQLAPPAGLPRARRRLKRLLRATGAARDARVQLRLFERLTPGDTNPGCRKFHRRLRRRDRRLTRELAKALRTHESGWHGLKSRRLFRPLAEAGAALPAARTRALRLAAGRILERQPAARTGDVRDRHRLRVALKKFRYLAETLPGPPAGLARLQRIQASLGDLHDFDLLLARLGQFAARHPATARWLETRRAQLQRRGQALLRRQRRLRFTAAELRTIIRGRP